MDNGIPEWIVNDNGELGVMVNGRAFFLYKGESLEYKRGLHDDGEPMLFRSVGKREFGETQWPASWIAEGRRRGRYTEDIELSPVTLYFDKDAALPEKYRWQPLPEIEAPEE